MNTARHDAVSAVVNYKSNGSGWNYKAPTATEAFGSNVFSDDVMKARLPKDVYKALQKTMKSWGKLDPTVADAVAQAMKDWAIEKGATHYAHVFLSADRPDRRKARQLSVARAGRQGDARVLRQGADPGRA